MVDELSVKYSQAEDEEISAFELAQKAHKYIILGLDSTFVCSKCNKLFTIHKSERCITFRCQCGCRIIYPKNKDGIRITTWIAKDEYKKNGNSKEVVVSERL